MAIKGGRSGSRTIPGRVSINEGKTVKGGIVTTGTLPSKPKAPPPSKNPSPPKK